MALAALKIQDLVLEFYNLAVNSITPLSNFRNKNQVPTSNTHSATGLRPPDPLGRSRKFRTSGSDSETRS